MPREIARVARSCSALPLQDRKHHQYHEEVPKSVYICQSPSKSSNSKPKSTRPDKPSGQVPLTSKQQRTRASSSPPMLACSSLRYSANPSSRDRRASNQYPIPATIALYNSAGKSDAGWCDLAFSFRKPRDPLIGVSTGTAFYILTSFSGAGTEHLHNTSEIVFRLS